MEDNPNPTTILTISDLINSAAPLTAASSLVSNRRIDFRTHSNQNPCCRKSISQNPDVDVQTLKPFNRPALIIGTVNLPSSDNQLKCNCFQFSDHDSTAICCEILDFDTKMIGQKIRILAWNFIPSGNGNGIRGGKGGFLEIIKWDFFQACSGSLCSLSDFSCSCLSFGACDVEDCSLSSTFGVIESISPVSGVPWESKGGSIVNGFLIHILVCKCTHCASKFTASKLRGVCERNKKDHNFIESRIIYFYGSALSWHPVVSRCIGDVVLLMGLKKHLVSLGKEESQAQLMYLTTGKSSLHVAKLSMEVGLNQNTDMRGKGGCGSYTGVITGIYMDGMVLELDQDVMLLLTEQHLVLPHYVRVGVLITLKNVHFVDPKFRWGPVLILGACIRTSMHLESFSPLESWCHLKQQFPSCLQKFIDSLSYAARLWALLVVSCFGKIFAGIFTEKEILGSRHKEGRAQKYARSYLPLSAFQIRRGVLLEFCRHDDLCSVDKEVDYGHLKLVLPIANLLSYCEVTWKKVFNSRENFPDVMDVINQKSPMCCGGKSYVQPIKRVLCSDEIGVVVLGTLKILPSSGRLQLVDATGSVDFILNLPQTRAFKIIEAKDFRLIMEDTHTELTDLNSTIYQPLSCRSIFSNALPIRKLNSSIYLYHCSSDGDSRNRSLFFECEGNSQDFDCEKYHLLWLTHKLPAQQKFQGDLAKRPNMFAEAIVVPWDLLVAGKYKGAIMTRRLAGHRKDPFENFARTKEHFTPKRCKIEHSAKVSGSNVDDTANVSRSHCDGLCSSHCNSCLENRCSNNGIELSCQNIGGVNIHWTGMLHRDSKRAEVASRCKSPRKVLLEFDSDCFFKYELLKIGCCYIVKHEEGDMLCCKEQNYQVSHAKVFISSGTHLRCLTLSSVQSIQSDDLSDEFSSCYLSDSSDERTKGFHQSEIPCLIGNSLDDESFLDINIYVPSSGINLLENFMKIMDITSNEPTDSLEEEPSIHDCSGLMKNSSKQSSGTQPSDCPLPRGNLITLHGLVLAVHDCHGVDFLAQSGHFPGEGSKLMFLQENAGICLHVFVDNHTVRIFSDRNKETCPIGLGRDVYATFHRVLALSELDKYMMISVSFITVDHASLMTGHHDYELSNASTAAVSQNFASQDTVSIALLSDAQQLSKLRPMQIRCKIVALYILVLEKARSTAIIHSRGQSIQFAFGIPYAGFIVDDGSSSCCCWADSNCAASFLGLDSEEYLSKDTLGPCNAGEGPLRISTVCRLNQALDRHGRIIVKNCRSMFDSSCQDLEFSVGSGRLLSAGDEDLLQSLITKAILSPSFKVDGSHMDAKTTTRLQECLAERDFAFPPLLNIWATSVCRTDTLSEARSIIRELV